MPQKRLPYYSKTLRDFVVAEMCECGHLMQQHGSMLVEHGEATVRLPNDGSCCQGYCTCSHYRWQRWVTADEYAALVVARRRAQTVA